MTRDDITSILNEKVPLIVVPDGRSEFTPRANFAVERAVLVLYARQTTDEQFLETTNESNSVGFNGTDAKILSSFARQILDNRGNWPNGKRLSPKQMGMARRKVQKYTRQLLEEAEAKQARKASA